MITPATAPDGFYWAAFFTTSSPPDPVGFPRALAAWQETSPSPGQVVGLLPAWTQTASTGVAAPLIRADKPHPDAKATFLRYQLVKGVPSQ